MSAYSVGFFLGALLVPLVLLGGMVFSVLAIVKAYTKRTTGWVVAGWLGGAFIVLIGLSATVGGAIAMFYVQKNQNASRYGSPGSMPAEHQPSEPAAGSETIVGRDLPYTLILPPGWLVKRGEKDFDLFAHTEEIYIGVIPEAESLGTPEKIASIARNKLKNAASDVQWSEPLPMQLDGRRWLQYTVQCKIDDIPFGYQFYVYSGNEGSFQIIGWTTQNLFEKNLPKMQAIMGTFHFPPAAASAK